MIRQLRATRWELLITGLFIIITNHSAQAEGHNWSQQCRRALQSRSLIARCGALLALRDRTLGHPDEVLNVYRAETQDTTRRRMALVLGESALRHHLLQRLTQTNAALAPPVAAFEEELEQARITSSEYWGIKPDAQSWEAANKRVESSAQRLSQRTEELLARIAAPLPSAQDERERQLLRWSIEVAALDATIPQFPLPLWEHVSRSEQIQSRQMLAAVDNRESRARYPQGYKDDLNTPYATALYWISTGRSQLSMGTPTPSPRILELRPLAPLLRVNLFRANLHPDLSGLYSRRLLSQWGDKAALSKLDVKAIEDTDGRFAIEYASIKARLGLIEGIDELWNLRGKLKQDPLDSLAELLDVGAGPVPDFSGHLLPWLLEEDRRTLQKIRQEHQRSRRFINGWKSLDYRPLATLTGKARDAYAAALRATYERERPNLRYSSIMQRFSAPGGLPNSQNINIGPVHIGLRDVGSEDGVARAWYALCAARAFDNDLDVSVGATRALLWGESASAQAMERAARRLQRQHPQRAALLANLRLLVPCSTLRVSNTAPNPFFSLLLRFVGTNSAPDMEELEPQIRSKLQPELIPFLLVYAEQNPRVWNWLIQLKAQSARPFLLREVEREKTGNELDSPKRDEYAVGYFMDLFPALEFYGVTESKTALLRHTKNSWWPNAALTPLGMLGGTDTRARLHARLTEIEGQPQDGMTTATSKALIIIQLARNGEAEHLEECIGVLKSGLREAPREAARALQACLPFPGPDFSNEKYDPPSDEAMKRVHSVWSQWFQEHQNQLQWNQRTRRYDVKTGSSLSVN